ncbi:CDP-glycerol glycerophosphotransferase family protein [Planomonospora sp. ID91781]|nr:CDP-glycerol glycerophosphotransferase family protein [Planomonospora sp. ID91781]
MGIPQIVINEPDCSVVVIAYNDAARLPRAVRSVLRQSLRAVEAVVVDDASDDGTEQVVRALMEEDPRVRYVRRERNSGGCGAPRNDGVTAARAPYVMFLDSDDRLPWHACKSLLEEVERTGADFVTGQITRFYEGSRRSRRYYPELFARRRTVEGIAAEPEMFLDSFATNKLYRAELLRRIPFREDLHFEDHVFTAELYCAARRFAVVPWTVYSWHRARASAAPASISLRYAELDNARQRVRAARLSDEVLRAHGHGALVPERHRRFLRQDLRVYLNTLPARDPAWIEEFVSVAGPYLAEIDPAVFDRIDPVARVCCSLILDGRADELAVAARSLNGPQAPPRTAVREGGRTYWGTVPSPGTDITALRLAELPFTASRLRHEAALAVDGTRLTLTVRTYDPFGVLAAHPGWTATLKLWSAKVRLAPRRQADGSHASAATVDLAALRHGGRTGFDGRYEPRVVVARPDGRTTSDVLLLDPAAGPVTVAVPGHTVTIRPDGHAGVLRLTWRRRGVLRAVPRLARARARIIRRLSTPELKLRVYKGLIRVLPQRRDLALFESDVGAGCTGSPRYVYEELRRRGAPIRVVWSVARNRRNFPKDARLVRRMSWRHIWTMARAGYWVDSHGLPLDYPKPPRTRYLQTWHGQGIKSIGFNSPDLRADFPGPRARWRAAVARWDALVAPSAEFERIFVPSNEYGGPVLRFGSPRCDVLVHGDPAAVERVRDRLELPPDRRVLLYAPTYRDQAKFSGRSIRADLEAMAEALADEWVVVLRPHPVERYRVPQRLRHFVRPAGAYPEINDLMLASDALLTDYSSVMCDYAVTGRPMLFLIDDWDEYRRVERGVYHDLPAIAPGPCLNTTGELICALRDLDAVSASFAAKYAAFRELWCADEKGEASARVVEAFFGLPPAPARARPPASTRPLIRVTVPGRLR